MEIRFIKLGRGGCWEKSCIEDEHTIRLGYESPFHAESRAGNWDVVRDFWLKERGGRETTASNDLNQIRDFYELSESDLWITFYKRRMYWCHAYTAVTELADGTRIRNVVGEWSCRNKAGELLALENIDGRVSAVQGYRGTICSVRMPEYVLRKINGEKQPEVIEAENRLLALKESMRSLIEGLWWQDFELLVELIFARAGWQRLSVLGKTEKDIDLDIVAPVSNKRAFVQVKSMTTPQEIVSCCEAFSEYEQFNEMFMVFHTLRGDIASLKLDNERIHIWDSGRVAEMVVRSGLVDWVIQKRA